jgi:hypothetical protein
MPAGRLVTAGVLTPQDAPARLCEMATDARAAVLLDASGAAAGSSGTDADQAGELAELARELLEAVDAAAPGEAPEQVETQVSGGAVYASRRPPWTLVAVTRRSALSSLMLYDMRAVLSELEAG